MALKLIRHAGTITASTMGDDAAHGVELGKLVRGNAIRVNEFAGNDVFVKLTLDGTAVTATNGTYVKASSSVIIHPEEKPRSGPGNILLDGTDSDSSDAGDGLIAESGVDSTGKTVLQYNRAEDNFTLSVKNETNGSDGGVHVEEVTHINTV